MDKSVSFDYPKKKIKASFDYPKKETAVITIGDFGEISKRIVTVGLPNESRI